MPPPRPVSSLSPTMARLSQNSDRSMWVVPSAALANPPPFSAVLPLIVVSTIVNAPLPWLSMPPPSSVAWLPVISRRVKVTCIAAFSMPPPPAPERVVAHDGVGDRHRAVVVEVDAAALARRRRCRRTSSRRSRQRRSPPDERAPPPPPPSLAGDRHSGLVASEGRPRRCERCPPWPSTRRRPRRARCCRETLPPVIVKFAFDHDADAATVVVGDVVDDVDVGQGRARLRGRSRSHRHRRRSPSSRRSSTR